MPSAEGPAAQRTLASASTAAAAALLKRTLPAYAADVFDLRIVPATPAAPHGGFRVATEHGRVRVEGTSPVELAAGAHWWLKHRAGGSVSWQLTGGLQLDPAALGPCRLAALEAGGRDDGVPRAVPLTFYQNVVTASYSFAFWDWERCVCFLGGLRLRASLRGLHACRCRWSYSSVNSPPRAAAHMHCCMPHMQNRRHHPGGSASWTGWRCRASTSRCSRWAQRQSGSRRSPRSSV